MSGFFHTNPLWDQLGVPRLKSILISIRSCKRRSWSTRESSHFGNQQLAQVSHLSDQPATHPGFPQPLLGLKVLLKQPTELKETLFYYQFIMKDTTQKQPKERAQRTGHKVGLKHHASCVHHHSILQPGALLTHWGLCRGFWCRLMD